MAALSSRLQSHAARLGYHIAASIRLILTMSALSQPGKAGYFDYCFNIIIISLDYYEQVKTLGFVAGSVTESEGYFSYMGYGTDNSQVVVSSQGLDDELTLGIITMINDSD